MRVVASLATQQLVEKLARAETLALGGVADRVVDRDVLLWCEAAEWVDVVVCGEYSVADLIAVHALRCRSLDGIARGGVVWVSRGVGRGADGAVVDGLV